MSSFFLPRFGSAVSTEAAGEYAGKFDGIGCGPPGGKFDGAYPGYCGGGGGGAYCGRCGAVPAATAPSTFWVRVPSPSRATCWAPSATAVSGWSRLPGTTPSFSAIIVPTSGSRLDPPTR